MDQGARKEGLSWRHPVHPHRLRKTGNLSWKKQSLNKLREMKIRLSRTAEAGITKSIAEKRAVIWQKKNDKAIESSNTYVEKHGLPLEKYRMF